MSRFVSTPIQLLALALAFCTTSGLALAASGSGLRATTGGSSTNTEVAGQDRCARGPAPGCTCNQAAPHPSTLSDGPFCFPRFESRASSLSRQQREAISGVSWRESCPVSLDKLRVVSLYHWGFDGKVHRGELVVAESAVDAVIRAFRQLYSARFPIQLMTPVERFDGSDERSMAANNTSAFNCRAVAGTQTQSRHSHGDAIDINPVQNPWVRERGDEILVKPEEGSAWLDRSDVRPGMIVEGGPAVQAFELVGWKWGGRWRSVKDYQHFSKTGR